MGGSGGLQGDNQNANALGFYIEPSGAAGKAPVPTVPAAYPNIGG
ncbi:MAG TPA: hypothetical protein VGY32_11455 [Solirubrobacteraceae bacterium]|jgi:hypothetical protein|nr:hypothetical protein [Solirubrobacteraceae bacterium]